ncbi:DUF6668 family protein [uncultured Pseudokineococcus sp.]|uniref:DUF6668 family protein n=1 Tax=uncultured Pseudokineococcus sp. TaxID=1642928 RepID=UPI00262D9682|nr:DUF6668 family protein [uncultured Pseudokineococcus sp.]
MRPQQGVDELDAVDRLPRRTPAAPALAWWLGAHGGAGETTLAEYLPGSRAADHAWPTSADATTPSRVVLVARSHARGLRAAQRALTDWASGAVPGVDLLGLVIVADAPQRLPKPLRDLTRVVGGGAPRVWHLPWIEAARYAPSDGTTPPPAPARRVLRSIAQLTDPLPADTAPTVPAPTVTTGASASAPAREDSR